MPTVWDEKYAECPGFFGEEPNPLVREFAELVRERCTLNMVLDLGCGPGRDSLYLAGEGMEVSAMDASEAAIRLLQERIDGTDILLMLQPVRADARDGLPFSDDFFQGIFAYLFLSLDFTDDELAFILGEIHRSLEPGGVFAGAVRSTADSDYGQGEQLGPDRFLPGRIGIHFFSEETLRDCLKSFRIERLEAKQITVDRYVFNVLEFVASKE